jgi:hypothetical protein
MKFPIARKSFELPASFLKKFKGKQPDWGPLGYFTFKRTYAHLLDPDDLSGGTEEWWQVCQRVVEGTFSIQKNHCENSCLPWDARKAMRSAKVMYQLMWDFKFLPPGRGLWHMGTGYVEKAGGAALNNCAFVSTKDMETEGAKPFCFLMDMSMVGVGVGFDARGAGKVEVLGPRRQGRGYAKEEFTIPDTREGWVESLRMLIDSYLFERPLPVFDYSKVRPAGAPIKGFGGVASGPQPLLEMHQDIALLLDDRIGDTLSSVDIIDIGNLVGRCVVAGNVRRTAEITFAKPDDEGFRKMKQDLKKTFARKKVFGIWDVRNSGDAYTALTEAYKLEEVPDGWDGTLAELRAAVREAVRDTFPSIHHRWASNNSIFATVGMDYSQVAEDTAVNGEPGYEWLDNARAFGRMIDPPNHKDRYAVGGNPCLEQTLWNYELCTLVETFPARHETYEEFKKTLKIAYLYAKTVTLVPTHWPETNGVMTKNRRIGCSQSGIIRAFKRHGRREMLKWCDMGYNYLEGLDSICNRS